jgi:hypothetical protein
MRACLILLVCCAAAANPCVLMMIYRLTQENPIYALLYWTINHYTVQLSVARSRQKLSVRRSELVQTADTA